MQALAQAGADAALIVSPSALHASQAIRCMEAGLTVMVEKPFGTERGRGASACWSAHGRWASR